MRREGGREGGVTCMIHVGSVDGKLVVDNPVKVFFYSRRRRRGGIAWAGMVVGTLALVSPSWES